MRSRKALLAAGVGTFLIGLLVMLPARVAYHLAAPAELKISGISGTVWSGNAQQASFNGVYLRDLHWRAQPLRLLRGNLAYGITGKSIPGFLESDLSVSFAGTVSMTSLQAALPMEQLSSIIGMPGLGGSAGVQFERIEIVDGLAVAADGTLDVTGLVIPLLSTVSLGGYRAEFFTQDDGIVASIEDTDGVVDLAGSLQVFRDRSFKILAQIVEKPETPDAIRKQLHLLPENARGQRELRREGTF